jgi:hypothetical protein
MWESGDAISYWWEVGERKWEKFCGRKGLWEKRFVGEKFVGEKFAGERFVGEKFVGDKIVGGA